MKHIALVGFSDLTLPRANKLADDVEIWSLNFVWQHKDDIPRVDRLFEIHPEWYLDTPDAASQHHYKKWLRREQGIPIIYTNPSAEDGDMDWVVNGVKYPMEQVLRGTGVANSIRGDEWQPMFGSTMDYMMALAVAELEAEDLIEVIGMEMNTETEYAYQKATMGYWMGAANQKGIIVKQQDISHMIRPLEYHQGGEMIGRQTVEGHLQHLQSAQSQMLGVYNQQLGVFNYMRQDLADKMAKEDREAEPEEQQAIMVQAKQAEDAKSGLDASSGAVSSMENLLREFDTSSVDKNVKPKMTSKVNVGTGD